LVNVILIFFVFYLIFIEVDIKKIIIKIIYTVITPHQPKYTVRCVWGPKPKNLLMARENLQVFFYRG